MPSSRFEHRVLIAAERASVWAALQEAETWSGLGPVDQVWDASHDNGVLSGYRWAARAGPRNIKGTAETAEAREPELMRIRLDAGEVKGQLVAALDEAAEGTSLSVTLEIRGDGLLSSVFWDVISGAIGGALPGQIENFATRMSR